MPQVIFSPGRLALALAAGLAERGIDVRLYTPGPADTQVPNHTVDLGYFEHELALRGDTYLDLLKKHPLVFVSLARQAQAQLIADAYMDANRGELDLVHVYSNEEDLAMAFAAFCARPVVFSHHDPFSYLVRYKYLFPKYKHLNWISMSMAQRRGMPDDTNWLANVYHGVDGASYGPDDSHEPEYFAYMGRLIASKGAHLAIDAVRAMNEDRRRLGLPIRRLKLAGKHYSGHGNDSYWQDEIMPRLGGEIEYVGFLRSDEEKQRFLSRAYALVMPSVFAEPFGLVMVESLACGTPVVGLASGAIPEVIREGVTGYVVPMQSNDRELSVSLSRALAQVDRLDRGACRAEFERRFTVARMIDGYKVAYRRLLGLRE
jgi:glycosyltransferase involved in cell wall biosynthesis